MILLAHDFRRKWRLKPYFLGPGTCMEHCVYHEVLEASWNTMFINSFPLIKSGNYLVKRRSSPLFCKILKLHKFIHSGWGLIAWMAELRHDFRFVRLPFLHPVSMNYLTTMCHASGCPCDEVISEVSPSTIPSYHLWLRTIWLDCGKLC